MQMFIMMDRSTSIVSALHRNLRLNTAHPIKVRKKTARPWAGSVTMPRMSMRVLKRQKMTGLQVQVL